MMGGTPPISAVMDATVEERDGSGEQGSLPQIYRRGDQDKQLDWVARTSEGPVPCPGGMLTTVAQAMPKHTSGHYVA